ncbi:MAG TPA: hypothetical protein VFM82_07800 [Flavobacteriaceae bacterium]|nr:hypothetical protein [Flavobacteriaceae bacterium]
MRTTFLILLLAFCGFATSCDNDDDNGPQTEVSLEGTWDLKNISGGFAGINADFEDDAIEWTFNEETSVLTINNTHPNDDETIYDGLESGTYTYELSTVDGENQIYINDVFFGVYVLSASELVIDQDIGADGYVFSFER